MKNVNENVNVANKVKLAYFFKKKKPYHFIFATL